MQTWQIYIFSYLYLRLSIDRQFLVQADLCLVTSIILVASHLASDLSLKVPNLTLGDAKPVHRHLASRQRVILKYNQTRRLSNTYTILIATNTNFCWKRQTPSKKITRLFSSKKARNSKCLTTRSYSRI